MKCEKCGYELQPTDTICPKCLQLERDKQVTEATHYYNVQKRAEVQFGGCLFHAFVIFIYFVVLVFPWSALTVILNSPGIASVLIIIFFMITYKWVYNLLLGWLKRLASR